MRILEEFEIKLTKIVIKVIIVFIVCLFIIGFWMFFNLKKEFRFSFFPIVWSTSYITAIYSFTRRIYNGEIKNTFQIKTTVFRLCGATFASLAYLFWELKQMKNFWFLVGCFIFNILVAVLTIYVEKQKIK
jgi:hypothetical protein